MTKHDLARMMESANKTTVRTGIEERRASKGETGTTIAIAASQEARTWRPTWALATQPARCRAACGALLWDACSVKAAVLSIALAACGAAPQPAPLSNHAEAAPRDAGVDAAASGVAGTLAKLWQLSDEMCHCSDRDCADRVVDEMMSWAQELAIEDAANPRVNIAEDAEAHAATDRISRCMSAAYARRAPSRITP